MHKSTLQQFPQRIVGYVPRKHILEPDGTYTYEAPQHEKGVTNSYSLVMTGASFVHRNYLKMFNESVPHEIHEMIDRVQNCEDLCMNVMVGDYLAKVGLPQPSGLYIKPQSIQYLGYLAGKLLCTLEYQCCPDVSYTKANWFYVFDGSVLLA